MYIKAAVARRAGEPLQIETLELEAPREDEILVRIHSTGICHTDLAVRDQHIPIPLPIILGHEGAGVVEQVGNNVTTVVPGDHVVMTFDYCGQCPMCKSGMPAYCNTMNARNVTGCRIDGSHRIAGNSDVRGAFFGQSSFATYALGTSRNVIKVPKDIDLAILGQLGCGIQTGAGAVLNRLRPAVGSSLLVCGVGPVGIAAVMAAKVAGCSVIVATDLRESRLECARSLGATHSVNVSDEKNVLARLRDICPEGFTNAVDTTGVTNVTEQAIELMAPLGTCVLLGMGSASAQVSTAAIYAGGRSICGSIEGDSRPDEFIHKLIELYREGRFPIDRLITRFPFDHVNDACIAAHNGSVVKPVLIMP